MVPGDVEDEIVALGEVKWRFWVFVYPIHSFASKKVDRRPGLRGLRSDPNPGNREMAEMAEMARENNGRAQQCREWVKHSSEARNMTSTITLRLSVKYIYKALTN